MIRGWGLAEVELMRFLDISGVNLFTRRRSVGHRKFNETTARLKTKREATKFTYILNSDESLFKLLDVILVSKIICRLKIEFQVDLNYRERSCHSTAYRIVDFTSNK